MKHELFETLDAVDPKWQTRYKTLVMAAETFGLLDLFEDFLRTPDGMYWAQHIATATDWLGHNELARAQYERELTMAKRAARKRQREAQLD